LYLCSRNLKVEEMSEIVYSRQKAPFNSPSGGKQPPLLWRGRGERHITHSLLGTYPPPTTNYLIINTLRIFHCVKYYITTRYTHNVIADLIRNPLQKVRTTISIRFSEFSRFLIMLILLILRKSRFKTMRLRVKPAMTGIVLNL